MNCDSSGTLTVSPSLTNQEHCGMCGQWYYGYHICSGASAPTYWYYAPTELTTCAGKAHVFECEHEKKCKCGQIERVMPRKAKK
jgi:hypothetical protein